jgi:NtrC-family two-component system sensor histidine kinase KinB
MFRTLRSRLLIGIAPLLAVMVGLGLWAVVMFYRLGGNIDVILRENYKSVRASQSMKEALERMDSALLFAIGGQEEQARSQFREFRPEFETSLAIERDNITVPGEQQLADDLTSLFGVYTEMSDRYFALPSTDVEGRTRLYFTQLLPTFNKIKDRADSILNINQRNMEEMDQRARHASSMSIRWMVAALIGSGVIATLIALLLSRSILEPIRAVTYAARAMARGDLEQVVPVPSRDELGELADAFNAMARRIREFQQAGTARLLRAQKTAQATIDSFPDPIVVVDLHSSVERANPSARRLLGVTPVEGDSVRWTPPNGIGTQLTEVLNGHEDYRPTGFENAITLREDGQERYFLPKLLAIRDEHEGLLGAAVVLADVTRFRLLDQLKSDMVATVSHELKTPLTSIQMAVYLLLEEVVGPLVPKQVELLMAARQDSERLLAMVNDLLDLTRIEQGRVRLDLQSVEPSELIAGVVQRFNERTQDAGITIETEIAPGLPPVRVDPSRIAHVFDNLVGNAIEHTDRGGVIRLKAVGDKGTIHFSVEDNGEGIAAEHLPHVFDRFYRVPGTRFTQGAGLGLAIAREIAVAHGGQLDVESMPGRGTTFTLTLSCDPTASTAIGNGRTTS